MLDTRTCHGQKVARPRAAIPREEIDDFKASFLAWLDARGRRRKAKKVVAPKLKVAPKSRTPKPKAAPPLRVPKPKATPKPAASTLSLAQIETLYQRYQANPLANNGARLAREVGVSRSYINKSFRRYEQQHGLAKPQPGPGQTLARPRALSKERVAGLYQLHIEDRVTYSIAALAEREGISRSTLRRAFYRHEKEQGIDTAIVKEHGDRRRRITDQQIVDTYQRHMADRLVASAEALAKELGVSKEGLILTWNRYEKDNGLPPRGRATAKKDDAWVADAWQRRAADPHTWGVGQLAMEKGVREETVARWFADYEKANGLASIEKSSRYAHLVDDWIARIEGGATIYRLSQETGIRDTSIRYALEQRQRSPWNKETCRYQHKLADWEAALQSGKTRREIACAEGMTESAFYSALKRARRAQKEAAA